MQVLIATRTANARQAVATARVDANRMTITTMQVNGGELMTRVHRDARGRITRHSHSFQGKRIERALALRLATTPRTVFRH